jgi:mono/diheme cytochrome c family protein
MPSANYRKLTEADVDALYAYFMDAVAPVAEPSEQTDLAFPFNQRWGIRAWKWLAYGDAGFTPAFDDPLLDRGAYLVEGPGHCGACHTPRNAVFVQKAYSAADPDFLTGGTIAGWSVPTLRGPESAPQKWSEADMVAYLRDGRNSHSAVVGEMHLVIEESLQYLTDDDLHAIAAYLHRIGDDGGSDTPAADMPQTNTAAMLTMAEPGMALGPRLYLDNCNACHFVDGKGADGVFPELDGNSVVTAALPHGLIDMILHGAALPSTEARPAPLRMPGFDYRLSDDEVATLATFLRGAWSNTAPAVTAAEVADVREEAVSQ